MNSQRCSHVWRTTGGSLVQCQRDADHHNDYHINDLTVTPAVNYLGQVIASLPDSIRGAVFVS